MRANPSKISHVRTSARVVRVWHKVSCLCPLCFMVSTFLVLVTSCSMLVPVVPDGLNIPGPGDVQGALTNVHACWCLNRRKDRYVELLRLETGISPGVGKRLPLPQEVKFRGILPEPVPSAVASQGRRSYSLLPREDARQFRQLSESRKKSCI